MFPEKESSAGWVNQQSELQSILHLEAVAAIKVREAVPKQVLSCPSASKLTFPENSKLLVAEWLQPLWHGCLESGHSEASGRANHRSRKVKPNGITPRHLGQHELASTLAPHQTGPVQSRLWLTDR